MNTLSIITQLVSVAFHRLLIFFFLILIVNSQVVAQSTRSSTDGSTPLGLAPGAPLGAYAISGFDNINPYNGHLNFRLPLLKTGGRGELNHNIALLIERKWRVRHDVDVFNQDHYSPDMNWWTGIEPGYGPGVMQFRLSGEGVQQCVSPPYDKFYNFTLTRLTFTASDGTEYELRDANTNGQPATVTISPPCSGSNASRGTVFKTADGSAATFVSDATIFDDSLLINGQPSGGGTFYPTGYLILRDGTRYRIENGLAIWIRDRNGNRMNFSYDSSSRVTSITDSLNRQVTISYNNPHVITFNGFGGNLRTTRVWHDTLQNRLRSGYSIQTYQQLFPQLNSASSSTQFNPSVVSSVELPDGRQYQFYYNSYGEIARVVLPTGGAFEYDYAAGVSGETLYNYITGTIIESMSGITAGGNEFEVYRRVTERRVYTNGLMLESKTVFSRPESYNSSTGYSTLGYVLVDQQDSGGTLLARAKHYYYGNSRSSLFQGATAYPGWKDAKEWKTEAKNTVSTVIKTTENTWQQPTATSNWPLTSAETSDSARPHNPMVTQTLMSLNDTSHVAKQTFTYDAYLNQTDVYEYDFGIGAPGALVRRVQTNYLTAGYDTIVGGINNPDPLATIHIRSLPTQQSVYDSNGVEMARTTYEYDTAALGSLVDRPGITGLVSRSGQAAGAGYVPTTDTMRGNVTKVSRWLFPLTGQGSNTEIASRSQYDIAGNVVKTRDPIGNDTTFDYSDSFSGSFTPNTFAFLKSSTSPTPAAPYGGGLALVSTSVYDFQSGKVVSTTDPNLKTSTFEYNDPLDRLTKVIRPSGGGDTEYLYGDVPGNLYLQTLTKQSTGFGGVTLTDYALFDGLGRATRSAHYEGSDFSGARWSVRDTRYDALGRVSQVSNPEIVSNYNAALPVSVVWTTTTYDALSRVTEVTTPDNAKVKTTYLGNQVTVEDQVNRKRSSVTDGLGRLIQVNEAPNDPNYNYQTNYTYDALGNLIRVRQGGFPTGGNPDPTVQFRRFYYDSLSRLVYANNPEQNATIAFNPPGESGTMWTMAYVYDNNGNLTGRTDARNVTTTYAYDALNRNTTVNYSDTPTISPDIERYYDTATNGKGRLQRVVSNLLHPGSASRVDSRTIINGYDDLGRVTSQTQGFLKSANNWQDYTVSRTYDLASHIKTQTYPSGGSPVTYSYGAGGRIGSFEGSLGGQGYFLYSSGMVYNATGQMTEEVFATSPTPIYHTARYNNRFQMTEVNIGTFNDVNNSASSAYWNRGRLRFFYSQTALNADDPTLSGTDNNGNVLRQEHWVPTATQTNQINAALSNVMQYAMPMRDDYVYDPINRIAQVQGRQRTASGYPGQGALQDIYQQTCSYDKFGNRKLDQAQTWGMGINGSVAADIYDVDKPTNRLKGMIYDAVGNLVKTKPISPQPENRVYDAENRMITATLGATSHYVYDGDGRRVRRILPSGEFWQVYGIDGELLAEYQWNGSTASLKKEYGYRDGQLLVVADPTETNANKRVQWLIADHLGTPRMVVDKSGSLSGVTRHDYLPFGEELMVGMGGVGNPPEPSIVRSSALGYSEDSVRQKFTRYERDGETGLDFAQARYYSNGQGRFISFDPLLASAIEDNPQSWNRYSYTINNPLKYVDPTGLAWGYFSGNAGNWYQWFDNEADIEKNGGTVVKANAGGLGFIYEGGGGWVRLDLTQNKWTQYESNKQAFYDQREFPTAMGDLANTLNLFMGIQSVGSLATNLTKSAFLRFSTTEVYRVEALAGANTRVIISETGQVSVQGENMLFLNFGVKSRAEDFLAKRLAQGFDDSAIKSFRVQKSFLKELQSSSVLESEAAAFPGRPLLVDATKAVNQFGLRPAQIQSLQKAIVQGSGKVKF